MNKKYFVVLFIISMGLISCDNWLDINKDPELATDIPAGLGITAGQAQIAGNLAGQYSIIGGIWSQHWAQNNNSSQYKDEDSYSISSADYNNEWDLMYSDALIDLKLAQEKAATEENWNTYLQAVAMQVYANQTLVDLYNKIPYSEALDRAFDFPVFDDGSAVYDGLIADLDEALAKDFSATSNQLSTDDFLFGSGSLASQIANWQAFANTLKLKIYLRQLEARPAVAEAGIKGMINAGATFLTGTDAAITQFEDADSKSNPLFETDRRQLNTTNNIRGSYTLVTYLNANNDPRVVDFFEPTVANGDYVGLMNGSFDVPSAALDPATHSKAAILPTQPFDFFNTEEVNFMLAEIYLRVMNDAGQAKTFYDAGVTAAMGRYGYDATDFIGAGGVYEFPSGMAAQFKAIMMQKWVSYVYRGYESFFDINRTGYPSLSTITTYPCDVTYGGELVNGDCDPSYNVGDLIVSYRSVLADGQFPKRLVFPDSELNVNPNAPAKVSQDVPVWWDVD